MQFRFSVPGCPWQSVLCPAGCSTHDTASRGTGSSWPSWAWRTAMMGCTAAQQIMELEQLRRAVGLSRWKCVSGNAISSWCHVSVWSKAWAESHVWDHIQGRLIFLWSCTFLQRTAPCDYLLRVAHTCSTIRRQKLMLWRMPFVQNSVKDAQFDRLDLCGNTA